MITRFFIKDLLSFEKVELEFKNGLVVFSGPSGSGKSVLMQSFLATFGFKDAIGLLSEATIDKATKENVDYDIDINDELIIKMMKKEKLRYFLNSQNIAKTNLINYIDGNIRYLHLADKSDFKSSRLLEYINKISSKKDKSFDAKLNSYKKSYKLYEECSAKLEAIKEEENKIEELKEFAKFEISKIEEIDPKIGEYEELSLVKKQISKKEKIEESIAKASGVFAFNSNISEALTLLEVDSSFYDDAINELSNVFETFKDKMYELEDINIEEVLTRIEQLAHLQKKFGSIEEALTYKQKKKEELEHYENISFEKEELEKQLIVLEKEIKQKSQELSIIREKASVDFTKKINIYLKSLYLEEAKVYIESKSLDINGGDLIKLSIKNVDLSQISSGELNRVRLSLIASISEYELEDNGILFLDEIDANVSGKESSAIANLLKELAKKYQIFAISHQPQLSSIAIQHFFIEKNKGKSSIKELSKEQRINEIARMISGENITNEALEFAKKLLV